MAVAPPLTFSLFRSIPSSLATERHWGTKASLTSTMSMSLMVRPERAKRARVAGTGPMPMIVGSQPATPQPTMRARGVRLYFLMAASSARTKEAAPSQMPDDEPAWTIPSFLNTVGSLARLSGVVFGRACSSTLNTSSPFFVLKVIGVISAV